MKNVRRLIVISVLTATLWHLSGCRKILDDITKDPTDNIDLCDIQSIDFNFPGRDTEAEFFYNKYGNPDSVMFTRVGTGNPNIIIRYDAQQRMTDFIQPYNNGSFERWQVFSYDNSDRIISEKFYIFGLLDTAPKAYFSSGTTNYEYDAFDRIIKAVTNTAGLPQSTQEFKYDASGNLVREGVTYDNKINLHRTNSVWMFIDRDYSRNNPFNATEYNTFWLPVMTGSVQTTFPTFLRRPISEAEIRYLCDSPKEALSKKD